MTNYNIIAGEMKEPRERLSQLSAAILRISASLDVDTVLQEIVDSARALTGARYGIITTLDESGEVQDFVSAGFTEEEHRQFEQWPDGPRLFEHFRNLPGVVRLADLPTYVRSLGYSEELMPSVTFQCTPMRHRDVHVGNFFLGDKEGGQAFTDADEEVLVLFASQAATAIANARTYRDEQRARGDLEALVETSPVGVIVFDARTGRPASINREAKRIVEGLRIPDRSVEALLEVATFQRADGRKVSLSEFPIAHTLRDAETVRAEEIVISVPDGRSITILLNVTPIRSEQEEVVSVVVTMQDLAPFQELERMRSDFLAMVSHELRLPLTSIKGSTTTVLTGPESFAPAEIVQFFRIIDMQADRMSSLIGDLLDAGRIESGALSVSAEPAAVADLVDGARTTYLSGGGRHRIVIDLAPDLPRVMADRQRIVQVLNNLLANAAQHSPEGSPIRIEATFEDMHVAFAVADEGRGFTPERLSQLFRKYARDEGSHNAGTGLGLAICKGLVEAHGGRIRAQSGGPGQGARFTFTLPAAEEHGAAPGDGLRSRPRHDKNGSLRILVVDDDPQTLRYVRDALEEAGYVASVTAEYENLERILQTERPALVLLDLVLPGVDGIELMQTVPALQDLPVLFISGYGRDETVAKALEAGAEDYIVKPFSSTELIARVRTALRRRIVSEPFTFGTLAIDYDRRRVTVAGRGITLTATEYELLRVLSLNAGQVCTYETLMRKVWGKRYAADVKVVHAYVMRLRRKLGDSAKEPTYIRTEVRVGYRMPRTDEA